MSVTHSFDCCSWCMACTFITSSQKIYELKDFYEWKKMLIGCFDDLLKFRVRIHCITVLVNGAKYASYVTSHKL